MPNLKIGVFDSGKGGELFAAYLRQQLPHLDIIAIEDQPNAPYGEKSPDQIYDLACQMIDRLITQQVDLIVVACHTISSNCFTELKLYSQVPILSVNEALLAEVEQSTSNQNQIGLLATSATIKSQWFPTQIAKLNKDLQLFDVACPLLATAIDQNNQPLITEQISQCLTEIPTSISVLALACTHYPLVASQMKIHLEPSVKIIDARQQTIRQLQKLIREITDSQNSTPFYWEHKHYLMSARNPILK